VDIENSSVAGIYLGSMDASGSANQPKMMQLVVSIMRKQEFQVSFCLWKNYPCQFPVLLLIRECFSIHGV
jgi:hypothetical protein